MSYPLFDYVFTTGIFTFRVRDKFRVVLILEDIKCAWYQSSVRSTDGELFQSDTCPLQDGFTWRFAQTVMLFCLFIILKIMKKKQHNNH